MLRQGRAPPGHLANSLCTENPPLAFSHSLPNCGFLAINKPASLVAGRWRKLSAVFRRL